MDSKKEQLKNKWIQVANSFDEYPEDNKKKYWDDLRELNDQISALENKKPMRRVIIESPYAGNVERNIKYARECVKHSLLKGESPIASHLLYTQESVLDDDILEERKLGIDAGLAWRSVAEAHVFYTDLGMNRGMKYAEDFAKNNGTSVEYRSIKD